VAVLPESRAAELLRPWLGPEMAAADLPLPRLIAVEFAPGLAPDVAAINDTLAELAPGARLTLHESWMAPLRRLARFVFTGQVPDKASATELLAYVSAETAEDLALKKAAYVRESDSLEHVVEIMFRFDINEIPVVDGERFIVGNLNMMELVAAWQRGRLEGLVG